jgi:hypothetical protein
MIEFHLLYFRLAHLPLHLEEQFAQAVQIDFPVLKFPPLVVQEIELMLAAEFAERDDITHGYLSVPVGGSAAIFVNPDGQARLRHELQGCGQLI